MLTDLDLLSGLLKIRRDSGEIKISTIYLAKVFSVSQQTISRRIRDLESLGYIERKNLPKGQIIWVTPKGFEFLRKKHMELKAVLEKIKPNTIQIGGFVISGSGEGSYYIGMGDYKKQIEDKLCFKPFIGTLNLKIKSITDMKNKLNLEKVKPIHISGFKTKERTFGDLVCYPCVVNKKARGALVFPERSHHPSDIIEVISPVKLRKTFGLKDGDYVKMEVLQ